MRAMLATALVLLVACDGGAKTKPAVPPPPSVAKVAPVTTQPAKTHDPAPATEEVPAPRRGKAPARACALLPAKTSFVSKTVTPAAVVATDDGFRVALYEPRGAGEVVALYRVSPGNSAAILGHATVAMPDRRRRNAPPALLAQDGGVVVGMVDGGAKIFVTDMDRHGTAGAWHAVGIGADTRFSPALWSAGGTLLVAWTETVHGENRLWVTPLEGATAKAPLHVMPGGLGGAAPVFLPKDDGGASLTFMDPREGLSPIVRVNFSATGEHDAPEVLRPVGSAAALPELAVARAGTLELLGYTVIGNAATTAVGYFTLATKDEAPTALVHGTGYGVLHVAAATGPNRGIFAAERPLGVPATSPRAIELRVADGEGLGDPLTLSPGNVTAFHVALARSKDGTLAVTYTDPDGVHVAWVVCDD